MSLASPTEHWLVGPETDDSLFVRLQDTLRALGYSADAENWALAGSQEISKWVLRGPRGELRIEVETYVGITLIGPPPLVAEVRERFRAAV